MFHPYKEFGYNEHMSTTMSRFLCITTIDDSVKKFGYGKRFDTVQERLCFHKRLSFCPQRGWCLADTHPS